MRQCFRSNQVVIGHNKSGKVEDDDVDGADRVKVEQDDNVETVAGVQVLTQPVNKKSNKKSFVYTNQSIALNVATGD